MINIEKIKLQIVKALIALKLEKIILFSLFAYGTLSEDSDIDICIVEKDYTNKLKEKATIRKLLSNIHVPMDILNPKLDEFEFYKKEINSVYCDADKQGILLWQQNS